MPALDPSQLNDGGMSGNAPAPDPAALAQSIPDLITQQAKANSDLLTVSKQTADANAAALNSLNEVQKASAATVDDATANMMHISRLPDFIVKVGSIFDSSLNANYQDLRTKQAAANVQNAANTAQTVLQTNELGLNTAKLAAGVTKDMTDAKFTQNSQMMQAQSLRMQLTEQNRTMLDRSIHDLSPADLEKTTAEALAGKGKFAQYGGLLVAEKQNREKAGMELSVLKNSAITSDIDTQNKANTNFLAQHFTPELLQLSLNKLNEQNLSETDIGGVKFTRGQMESALVGAKDLQDKAIGAMQNQQMEDFGIADKSNQVALTAQGLAATGNPNLRSDTMVAQVNKTIADTQGDVSHVVMSNKAIDAALVDFNGKIKQYSDQFSTPEGKAASEAFARNGGRYGNSQEGTAAFSELVASPGAAEGSLFAPAILLAQTNIAKIRAKQMGTSAIFGDNTDGKAGPVDLGSLLAQVKPEDRLKTVKDMLADPAQAAMLKTSVTATSTNYMTLAALRALSTPKVQVTAGQKTTVAPDPIWQEFDGLLRQDNSPFKDANGNIVTDSVFKYLSRKSLATKNTINYGSQFVDSLKQTAVNFESDLYKNSNFKDIDRAIAVGLYNNNFAAAMQGNVMKSMLNAKAQSDADMQRALTGDLSADKYGTAILGAGPEGTTVFNPGNVLTDADILNSPSESDPNTTVGKVRDLVGGKKK